MATIRISKSDAMWLVRIRRSYWASSADTTLLKESDKLLIDAGIDDLPDRISIENFVDAIIKRTGFADEAVIDLLWAINVEVA